MKKITKIISIFIIDVLLLIVVLNIMDIKGTDVSSYIKRMLGIQVVTTEGTQYYKTDDEHLVALTSHELQEEDLEYAYNQLLHLQEISENHGANFLYFAVPEKSYFGEYEDKVVDYSKVNYDKFISGLRVNGIAYVDLQEELFDYENPMDAYYKTDSHWKIEIGLEATESICQSLNARFDFGYNDKLTDSNRYSFVTYEDYFLGSYGKNVGTYFTSEGADDFVLLTPAFETALTVEVPSNDSVRSGSFEETLLYMENLEKDYYGKDVYATYSGGDYRLQIIKNNLIEEGNKVLIIRDSFGGAVTPFLSLQVSELHICDVRDGVGLVDAKINIEEYINEIHPDYVLVLYAGTDMDSGRNDFFAK